MSDRDELSQLCDDYSRVQYPGMEVIRDLSEAECARLGDEARRLGCRIADLVIDMGLHRGGAR